MAAAMFSNSVLKAKFRGSMIGALLGDCLGAPFETDSRVSKRILTNYINNLMREETIQILPYTDDTSMTLSVASSLADKGEVNAKDMAEKFVNEYYSQPKRGYGMNVVDVFRALRDSKFEDVFLPSKLQFNGSGSYGNGAAMRIAPIALFGNNKSEEYIVNAAKECALITHAHPNGYNGAILQCLAVNMAFGLDSSQELDPVKFINGLQEKMEAIETKDMNKPYCKSLKKIEEIYLQNQEDISSEEIAEYLGNEVSALKSVPTAIYSFLRGLKPFKDYFENSNPFLRTIFFAISVGGDTDTIASMAGSIAGAYYGVDMIPDALQKRCELIDEVISLADKLFHATYNKE